MTAIILAAGRGTRLKPLTLKKPKPLLEIRGKSILENMIERLRGGSHANNLQVKDIIVVTGYKAELFTPLAKRLNFRQITYSDYASKNSAASLKLVKDEIKKGCIILNADLYLTDDFLPFIKPNVTQFIAQKITSNAPAWGYIVDSNFKILDIDTNAMEGFGDGVAVFDNASDIKIFKKELENLDDNEYWEMAVLKNLHKKSGSKINFYAHFADFYTEIDSFKDALYHNLLTPEEIATQCSDDGKIKRLGGITNINYKITFEGKSKVIRIPRSGLENVLDLNAEKRILAFLKSSNASEITASSEFFDSNIKMSNFLDGYKTLSVRGAKKIMPLLVDRVRRLHGATSLSSWARGSDLVRGASGQNHLGGTLDLGRDSSGVSCGVLTESGGVKGCGLESKTGETLGLELEKTNKNANLESGDKESNFLESNLANFKDSKNLDSQNATNIINLESNLNLCALNPAPHPSGSGPVPHPSDFLESLPKIPITKEIQNYEKLANVKILTSIEHRILMDIARRLDNDECVLCHLDLQAPNLMYSPSKNDLKLIDFEYAGLTSSLRELGNLSAELEFSKKDILRFLKLWNETYFDGVRGLDSKTESGGVKGQNHLGGQQSLGRDSKTERVSCGVQGAKNKNEKPNNLESLESKNHSGEVLVAGLESKTDSQKTQILESNAKESSFLESLESSQIIKNTESKNADSNCAYAPAVHPQGCDPAPQSTQVVDSLSLTHHPILKINPSPTKMSTAKNHKHITYKNIIEGQLIANYIWALWGFIYDRQDLARHYLRRVDDNLKELEKL